MRRYTWPATLLCSMAIVGSLLVTARAQELPKQSFKAAGTWSNLTNYQANEQPFWTKTLPAASKGQITGTIQSISELGLKGTELMRMLKLGLFDFVHALPIYIAEDAMIEAIDIAGVAKDFATARKTTEVYAATFNEVFEKKYGAKALNFYTWPAQMIYCNGEIKGVASLKGKKIRVQGTSQADLVEALGGVGVTIPFADVVPALQRGTVDCGITGTMPAFKAGWHEVTTHVLNLPVGFSISFTAVSLATWGKLDEKTRSFIDGQVKGQTNQWWKTITDENDHGLACTTGQGTCTIGKAGKVQRVDPTPADIAARDKAVQDVVLKRWVKRCGANAACVSNWNNTIGKLVGMTAAP